MGRRATITVLDGVGVEMLAKTRDEIEEGQPVARLYGTRDAAKAEGLVLEALELSNGPVERSPVVLWSP